MSRDTYHRTLGVIVGEGLVPDDSSTPRASAGAGQGAVESQPAHLLSLDVRCAAGAGTESAAICATPLAAAGGLPFFAEESRAATGSFDTRISPARTVRSASDGSDSGISVMWCISLSPLVLIANEEAEPPLDSTKNVTPSAAQFAAMIGLYKLSPPKTERRAPYTYENFQEEFTRYCGADQALSDGDLPALKLLAEKHPGFFKQALNDSDFLETIKEALGDHYKMESFFYQQNSYSEIYHFIETELERSLKGNEEVEKSLRRWCKR